MLSIDYFKRQAKNLLQDQRTRVWNEQEGLYEYFPRFYDVDAIFLSFSIFDEEEPTLQRAQHLIANIAGFDKWSDLINCSPEELAFRKFVFENQNYLWWEEWINRYEGLLCDLKVDSFDIESQMELYKQWVTANKEYVIQLDGTGFLLERK